MKPNKQVLEDLIASARQTPATPQSDAGEPLPPGLATRIAARWAARPSASQVWERAAAVGFVCAIIVCASAALFRPRQPVKEPDPLLSLFYARPAAPVHDFPF